jgi:hypothetical protein
MEEFLSAILSALAELLFELLFEVFLEAIVGLIVRATRILFSDASLSPPLAAAFYLLLGCASGAASLLLFPHPIFHPSTFHGISLLISPLLTGFAMAQVGRFLRRSGRESVRIESFAYGFAFAFGFAMVRLIFVR